MIATLILLKVTLAVAMGLIGVRLARKSRAAVLHAWLAAVFGTLLVTPIASILSPPVSIAMPVAAARLVPGHAVAAVPRVAAARVHATPALPRPGVSLSDLLLTGWIAGAALFLVPVAMGLRQIGALRWSARPWPQGQAAADRLARDAGMHRRVEVLVHKALPGPMTCGMLHPAIVLAGDAETWDAEELDRALIHELEHVRRNDWVSQCMARTLCAVYWFNPLVWMARRQFALEAERACDDAVLGSSEATAYADQLVGLAQRLSMGAQSPFLAMANRTDLATRVGAVLDSGQRRGRAGRWPVAMACIAAAAMVVTISPLTMVAAAPQASAVPQLSGNGMLVIETVKVTDASGRTIEGLGVNDFVLTEDGVPQTIGIFEFEKAGAPDTFSSYYVLGYYTRSLSADGRFRKIEVVRKGDTMAKLEYRSGFYSVKNWTGASGGDSSVRPDSTVPVLISKREPEYSEEARKAKYQGTVLLDVEIDGSGQVTDAKVVRRLGLGLDEKAIEAVKQWQFRPALKDGRPISTHTQVPVNFRLL